jgi:hypothetical protein
MSEPIIIGFADRLAADVFQKSYRGFLALKPTHYRWSELAPQSVQYLGEAEEEQWSIEKIADYLHCEPDEAKACQRRFRVSKKVNEKENTAGRIKQGIHEWLGTIVEMDEMGKRALVNELSKIVANQLYAAALSQEDMLKLSIELEGMEPKLPKPKPAGSSEMDSSKWGPQWKD